MRKISKSTYGFIFAIVVLVILLGISLYLGISGWFFSNVTSLQSDLELGQTVNISMQKTESKAVSFTFPGSYLPGQKLPQYINITNNSDTDLYIRAKAVVFSHEQSETNLEVGISDHWTQENEYYYFDEPLLQSNKIAFATYIKLLDDEYYNSNKSYVVTIIVEALDVSLDKTEIWGY